MNFTRRTHTHPGTPLAAVLLIAAVFAATVSARGAEPTSNVQKRAPGGESLSMLKFYAGPGPIQTGTFPGTLVCLHAAGAKCTEKGQGYALQMEHDSMLHPLLPGTKEVLDEIKAPKLQNAEVEVRGMYYPSIGAILVNQITARKSK